MHVMAPKRKVTGAREYFMQLPGSVHWYTGISSSNSLLTLEWNRTITCELTDRITNNNGVSLVQMCNVTSKSYIEVIKKAKYLI